MRNFVIDRVKNLEASSTVGLMNLAKQLKAEGHDIINLAGGEPNFNTPGPVIEEAYNAMKSGFTSYVNSTGIPSLKKRIARKLEEENQIQVDEEKGIIVTSSSKLALHMSLFTFAQAGDEVMYLEPAYVSYKPLIELTGAKAVAVPLSYEDNYEVTAEILNAYATQQTKALLICTPNNPTGRVLTVKETDVIANFAKEKDILVISDEIYERIIFDDNKHISIASLPGMSERVITLNGFSKTYAMAGWRLGYIAAAPALIKEIAKVQQHILNCAPSFVQSAAVTALDCEVEVRRMVQEYKDRRDYFVGALNTINGVECRSPEGAFYVMVRIDYKGMDSFELSQYVLEHGKIAAAPGEAFGQGGEKCIRMPFATSMEELEEAVVRLKKIFPNENTL